MRGCPKPRHSLFLSRTWVNSEVPGLNVTSIALVVRIPSISGCLSLCITPLLAAWSLLWARPEGTFPGSLWGKLLVTQAPGRQFLSQDGAGLSVKPPLLFRLQSEKDRCAKPESRAPGTECRKDTLVPPAAIAVSPVCLRLLQWGTLHGSGHEPGSPRTPTAELSCCFCACLVPILSGGCSRVAFAASFAWFRPGVDTSGQD